MRVQFQRERERICADDVHSDINQLIQPEGWPQKLILQLFSSGVSC